MFNRKEQLDLVGGLMVVVLVLLLFFCALWLIEEADAAEVDCLNTTVLMPYCGVVWVWTELWHPHTLESVRVMRTWDGKIVDETTSISGSGYYGFGHVQGLWDAIVVCDGSGTTYGDYIYGVRPTNMDKHLGLNVYSFFTNDAPDCPDEYAEFYNVYLPVVAKGD